MLALAMEGLVEAGARAEVGGAAAHPPRPRPPLRLAPKRRRRAQLHPSPQALLQALARDRREHAHRRARVLNRRRPLGRPGQAARRVELALARSARPPGLAKAKSALLIAIAVTPARSAAALCQPPRHRRRRIVADNVPAHVGQHADDGHPTVLHFRQMSERHSTRRRRPGQVEAAVSAVLTAGSHMHGCMCI